MKKALAMKCTQEQWDSIKDRFYKKTINSVTSFDEYDYLINFDKAGKNKRISNIKDGDVFKYLWEQNPEIHETFNAKLFLDACGIDCEPKYSITKLQLTQLLKNNEEGNEQLVSADLRAWFPDAFKNELEVGRWYTPCNNYDGIALLRCENPENKHSCGYGFDFKGKWTKTYSIIASDHVAFREATKQEVEDAFISDAKKRGYEENISIVSMVFNEDVVLKKHKYKSCDGDFYFKKGYLYWNGFLIFKNGQWATIIQPEKMTLEQIEKELGRKIEIV